MSLTKRLCLRSPSEMRQSFSERICDDLCEEILQYLSLEDKLRLECVSKQFQKTIILKQRELVLNSEHFRDRPKKCLKRFKHLLKKFVNINEIIVKNDYSVDSSKQRLIYNKFIELIVKYCNNLTHFDFYSNDMSNEVFSKFIAKFGLQLTSAQFKHELFPGVRQLSKLEKLTVGSMVSAMDFSHLYGIQFTRLKWFEMENLLVEDLDTIEKFFELNSKTIKYLKLVCNELEDEEDFKRLLHSISLLPNLIHLSLGHKEFALNDKLFAKQFKQIALNCNQIESIECLYSLDPNDSTTKADLFSPLRQFKRLKRLYLQLFCRRFTSFKMFKGFQQLKDLTIYSEFDLNPTGEAVLSDIDINLPKLQSMKIHFRINASEWTADILSGLSRLQTIRMCITDEKMRANIRTKLIENCKRIKSIKLEPH